MSKLSMVLATIGLTILLQGCGDSQASVNQSFTTEPTLVAVATEKAFLGEVFAEYVTTATLEAISEAPAVARVGGEVLKINVEEGDVVAAGQVLAVLDTRELQLNLAKVKAEMAVVGQDLKRKHKLSQIQMISQGELEAMEYELEALQNSVDLAELQLGYGQIRAPIAGVVSSRDIKKGNTLNVGDGAFMITDTTQLQAKIDVPQNELALIKAKQSAVLEFDARPGQVFEGSVERIAPTIDTQTGTFRVTLDIKDPKKLLRPGMFGRFNIVYEQHDGAVLIPETALLHEDKQTSVFIVRDGVAYRRPVDVGLSNHDHVEILSGVDAGEQVVTVGQATLNDGTRVQEQSLELATYTF